MKNVLCTITTLLFCYVQGQSYIDLINSGEQSLSAIEAEAERYFKKVGTDDNTYKFYQRWLYAARMDADENGMLTTNSIYLKELQRYESERNFKTLTNHVTQTAPWVDMGPTGKNGTSGWNPGVGRITSLAFENTNHFIVGSPTGGIWKTTDAGQSWSCLTDNLSNIDVYSLALHPTDSNTYFWGSTEGRIFKSTDGGASWSLLNGGSLLGTSVYDRVNKILIKPDDSNIIYASVEYKGVYRSSDAGVNWSKIHSESLKGYDIEFNPSNTNEVYATGNHFFKSTDNGASFTKFQTPDLTIDGANWSQELISGTHFWTYDNTNQNNTITPKTGNGMGIFLSENFNSDSARLVSRTIDLSSATNALLAFSYSSVNYEGDVDQLSVLYRKNAQESWSSLASYTTEAASWTDIEIDISSLMGNSSSFQIAFTAVSKWGRGLTLDDVRIKDAAGSDFFYEGFEDKNNLLESNFSGSAKMLGVSAHDPSKIYLLEEKNRTFNGLYLSTDNGASFTKLNHEGKNYFGYSSTASDDRGQAPRDMDITVDPNNSNNVYMAGILSWRSTDAGNTFSISSQWIPSNASSQNIGYCHADIDIIEWVNGNLFVGSDGGVFIAPDPDVITSSYYTDLSDGLGVRQFYKIGVSNTTDEVISGGSQDNGTSVYVNGVWKDWLGADGMETFVDKNDNTILYGTSQYGNLYKSENQGNTEYGIQTPTGKAGSDNGANWIVPFEQDPSVQDKIYVAYDEVFSQEASAGWVSISQQFNENIDHFKIAPIDNTIMYLSVNDLLYKTTDGGQTDWTGVSLPGNTGNINAIALNKDDPNLIALACSGSNKVLLSIDGGTSWQVLNSSLPNFSANALCFYGADLILGMNYGIFYNSATNRSSWDAFSDNLPNVRVYELEVNHTLNKVYAGTYGRGLWSASLDPAALSTDNQTLAQIQVYPNPVSNEIKLKLPQPTSASLKLYNAAGQIVYYAKKRTLALEHKIDVSNLIAGTYVLRITTANQTAAFKLIKQ